jgi:hypothetical protein
LSITGTQKIDDGRWIAGKRIKKTICTEQYTIFSQHVLFPHFARIRYAKVITLRYESHNINHSKAGKNKLPAAGGRHLPVAAINF